MKKPLAILCIGLTLVGCAGKPTAQTVKPVGGTKAAAPEDPALVAEVNGQPITRQQLEQPLIEGYGLNVLFNLVQLEMAKQAAAKRFIVVSDADFKSEMDTTVTAMFAESNTKQQVDIDTAEMKGDTAKAAQLRKTLMDDNYQGLAQYLEQRHLSRPEFDLVIRTNAYLRKLVEPTLRDAITDKMIEDGFRFQYGEKVQVRHIQCANWQDIAKAKARLAKGDEFADVARDLSNNARTAPLGGELRPFSRAEPGLSDAFKDAAFSLKEGEVSDAVIAGSSMHLIKLEKRIAPTAVKLDDVRDAIRRELYQGLLSNGMRDLRLEFGQKAMQTLKIYEPTLKAQYDKKALDEKSKVQGADATRKKLAEEREVNEKTFTTQPAATSAPAAATMPASVPATAPAAK